MPASRSNAAEAVAILDRLHALNPDGFSSHADAYLRGARDALALVAHRAGVADRRPLTEAQEGLEEALEAA